jgi:IS5 family transposase
MKLHIGMDSQSGLAHSAVVTPANMHDKHPLPDLLHGQEERVYGDSAYASQKKLIRSKAPKAKDFTNERTRKNGEFDEIKRGKNRNKSKIRARVEHVFAVVKRLWGFTKVRYRGLAKNACRAFTALALANIYWSRKQLMAQVRPYCAKAGTMPARMARKGKAKRAEHAFLSERASKSDHYPKIRGLFSVALNPDKNCLD